MCHSYYKDETYRKSLTPYRLYFFRKDISLKDLHHRIINYYHKIKKVNDYENEVINVEKKEQPLRLLAIPFSRYSVCEYCGKKNCDGCEVPY